MLIVICTINNACTFCVNHYTYLHQLNTEERKMKNLTDQEVETITDSLHSRREEILKTLLNEFDDNSIVLELVEDLKKVEALYNRFI